MSHAIMGVLTCAHIHSIELDRMLPHQILWFLTLTPTSCSGRGRFDQYVRWHPLDHASSWLPWLVLHWRLLDRVRFRYQREQGCDLGAGRFLPVHALVG